MFNVGHGDGSVAEIARATDYARPSIQRLADTLVAQALATYSPDPDDRLAQPLLIVRRVSVLSGIGSAMLRCGALRMTRVRRVGGRRTRCGRRRPRRDGRAPRQPEAGSLRGAWYLAR